ncbi:DUF11 domain-containing protein [Micromonospora soli]|uniref:DUF11 domain-containing protein n=1 Tax=Micromonospora sp. NBRC 110009 TaxID=3061627 RepID=UPI0026721EF1|nr:DUF11 domain-containing protein [Micromonospora sp. NBRC 110009]WKT99999.1 DUF11 domain-containing protein [Micromonospora sp. NBRC 110009]
MSRLARTRLLTALLLGLGSVVVSAHPARAAGSVDVFVDVSGAPDPVWAGGSLFYSVAIGNRGPDSATGTLVTAPLPAGVSFVSSSDARCGAPSNLVTCDLGTLGASGALPLIIEVRPTEAGLLSMTFTASAAEPDADPSDNTATVTTTVATTTEADLALRVNPPTTPVHAGSTFFVGIEMHNGGPAPATGVTTTLRVPAGLTIGSAASCVPDGPANLCTIGGPTSLPPATGVAGPIAVTATAPGDWTITGSVTADQPDPQPANNVSSGTVTALPAADLSVTIGESADPTPPGRPLTWSLTVTNHGPSPSVAHLAHEWSTTVPGGLALLSVEPSQGVAERRPPAGWSATWAFWRAARARP